MALTLNVRTLVAGDACGELQVLSQGLSFWGGLDPASGVIIDRQHPQLGACIRGRILVLPAPRGSTAAPGALLECLAAAQGPAAIVLAQADPTPIAAVLAAELIALPIVPVAQLAVPADLAQLITGQHARLCGQTLRLI
jgi:cis-L-3-hydroxyproline dehydratase